MTSTSISTNNECLSFSKRNFDLCDNCRGPCEINELACLACKTSPFTEEDKARLPSEEDKISPFDPVQDTDEATAGDESASEFDDTASESDNSASESDEGYDSERLGECVNHGCDGTYDGSDTDHYGYDCPLRIDKEPTPCPVKGCTGKCAWLTCFEHPHMQLLYCIQETKYAAYFDTSRPKAGIKLCDPGWGRGCGRDKGGKGLGRCLSPTPSHTASIEIDEGHFKPLQVRLAEIESESDRICAEFGNGSDSEEDPFEAAKDEIYEEIHSPRSPAGINGPVKRDCCACLVSDCDGDALLDGTCPCGCHLDALMDEPGPADFKPTMDFEEMDALVDELAGPQPNSTQIDPPIDLTDFHEASSKHSPICGCPRCHVYDAVEREAYLAECQEPEDEDEDEDEEEGSPRPLKRKAEKAASDSKPKKRHAPAYQWRYKLYHRPDHCLPHLVRSILKPVQDGVEEAQYCRNGSYYQFSNTFWAPLLILGETPGIFQYHREEDGYKITKDGNPVDALPGDLFVYTDKADLKKYYQMMVWEMAHIGPHAYAAEYSGHCIVVKSKQDIQLMLSTGEFVARRWDELSLPGHGHNGYLAVSGKKLGRKIEIDVKLQGYLVDSVTGNFLTGKDFQVMLN